MPVWSIQHSPKKTEIALSPRTFATRERQTGYLINALINRDQKVTVLLDTGADGITIHSGAVRKLKLEVVGLQGLKGIGDYGEQKSKIALAQTVSIGSLDCIAAAFYSGILWLKNAF